MSLDNVKQIVLLTMISVTNRLLLLFGLVKLKDANAAIEQFYANARSIITAMEVDADAREMQAKRRGVLSERERVSTAISEDMFALEELVQADKITAKELRAAYTGLLPCLYENVCVTLYGKEEVPEQEQEGLQDGE